MRLSQRTAVPNRAFASYTIFSHTFIPLQTEAILDLDLRQRDFAQEIREVISYLL
jgi:hypothetical protein